MAADFPRAPTETSGERFAKLEVRLENGQKEFMALREEQRAIRATMEQMARDLAPKPVSRLQLLAFAAGPVVLLAGFVWQAARYPDRTEFNVAQEAAVASARKAEEKLYQLESAQAVQAKDLASISGANERHETALEKIDAKLDRVLAGKVK